MKSSEEATQSPAQQADDVFPPRETRDELDDDMPFDGLDFKSKEESSKGDFSPLKETIYDVTLESATVGEQARFGKPDEVEKVIKCTFVVEGRADGKPIVDIDGNECDGGFRKLWATLSLRSTGFKNGGSEPGKTRAAICALTGNDPEKPFKLSSLNEIIGKSCKVFVTLVPKKDGGKKNKIDKYITN